MSLEPISDEIGTLLRDLGIADPGVSARLVVISAWPNARSSTTRPLCATAITEPGCSDCRIW